MFAAVMEQRSKFDSSFSMWTFSMIKTETLLNIIIFTYSNLHDDFTLSDQ